MSGSSSGRAALGTVRKPHVTAQAQVRASVADGVYVMPNGIYSVARAQEAGCSLFIPG